MRRVIRFIAIILAVINAISLITFLVGIYVPTRFEVGILLLDNVIALLIIARYVTDVNVDLNMDNDVD